MPHLSERTPILGQTRIQSCGVLGKQQNGDSLCRAESDEHQLSPSLLSKAFKEINNHSLATSA